MFDFFSEYGLTTADWAWLMFCAICVGMAKTGLGGLGMLIVPILASIFGSRSSTGFLLPMLIMADVFAVYYYNRHAEFKSLIKLIPSTVAGVLFAIFLGNQINEAQFSLLLGAVIIAGILIMVWRMTKASPIPDNKLFAASMGFLGGFTTMIGNAAGPVMSIYFLSMNLNKNTFIGTAAWFFLAVNVFKVPFHIWVWETINLDSFLFNLSLFPLILVGVVLGIWIVKKIPEKPYKIFIIASVFAAALKLFF